jgi:hypothetical protein
LVWSLGHPNTPPLAGSFGALDAQGTASASFTLGPGQLTALVGLQAHHAFGALDPVLLALELVSNPAALAFKP